MSTSIDVRSLAAFKRFLAMTGATVTVIRHDFINNPAANSRWSDPDHAAAVLAPRTVAKLQTNAVRFSNGSWLYFDKSGGCLAPVNGSKGFRFEGDTMTIDLSKDGSFSEVCIYRLSVASGRET